MKLGHASVRRYAIVTICAMLCSWLALTAQNGSNTYKRVYVGADGLVHLVDAVGRDLAIQAEHDQVSVSSAQISSDGRAVGWLVNEDSCCQSYAIPLRLVVYSGRTKNLIQNVQMIYAWSFVQSGRQIAISKGTTHGQSYTDLMLFDTRTGRRIAEWNNNDKPHAPPPNWAPHS